MNELTFDQVDMVSGGGLTENQCIGAYTLAGGVFGFFAGGPVGAGLGLGFGAATGGLLCHYLVK